MFETIEYFKYQFIVLRCTLDKNDLVIHTYYIKIGQRNFSFTRMIKYGFSYIHVYNSFEDISRQYHFDYYFFFSFQDVPLTLHYRKKTIDLWCLYSNLYMDFIIYVELFMTFPSECHCQYVDKTVTVNDS